MLAGRGGSVSRRDHNQAFRKRAHFQAEPTSKERLNPNASYSSGEGVWGRGASLREAASPPESPHCNLFGREREGGDFSSEKASPSQASLSHQHRFHVLIGRCDGVEMVGGDEELDDGLGEEGGERGTFIDVFGAWGERISSRQRSADVENKIDRAFLSLLLGSVSSGSIAQGRRENS